MTYVMESLPFGTDVDETLPLEVPEADLANVDGVKKLLDFEDAAVAAAGASTEVAPTVPTTDSGKVGGGVAPIVPTTDSEKVWGYETQTFIYRKYLHCLTAFTMVVI